jgi:hypothetical protein
MQHDYTILNQAQNDAYKLKYEGSTQDFVLNHTNAGGGSNYVLPVPKGCNRVEILCRIIGGAAGTLQVWRQVTKTTDPSGFPMQVIAATLAFNANGTRQVIELPPNTGRLYAEHTGMPAGAQMNVIATFWREG